MQAAARAIEGAFAAGRCSPAKAARFPVVSTFPEVLGLPTVLFGIGLPDENAHAPNEKLDLVNFHNGVIASAHLYDEIAGVKQKAWEQRAHRGF